jgi:ubiquinone/menaquinone biosynthesis C-methylase UbiE
MPDLKSFDRVAHCYDETRGMPPAVTTQVADAIAEALQQLGPRPRLLEVGIGTGRIAVPLAERGIGVTGLDIAPGMVAVLRQKRPDIGVMFAEAARPPLKPHSFDALLFVHVLHLVPDPVATMRATLPLVRPGGMIVRGNEHRPDGSLDEQLGDLLYDTTREVLGIDIHRRGNYDAGVRAFDAALRAAGCAIEERTVAKWDVPLTGRQVQDGLLAKNNSGSWQIPDDRLQELHDALEPRIAALMGGMDVSRPATRRFDLTIAKLPST